MTTQSKRKVRFYYMKNRDVHDYIRNNVPYYNMSRWIQEATREKMKRELKRLSTGSSKK